MRSDGLSGLSLAMLPNWWLASAAFLFLRVRDGTPDPGAALDVAGRVDRWPVSQVSSSCASLNVGTTNAASAIVTIARITVLFRSSAKMTNDSA